MSIVRDGFGKRGAQVLEVAEREAARTALASGLPGATWIDTRHLLLGCLGDVSVWADVGQAVLVSELAGEYGSSAEVEERDRREAERGAVMLTKLAAEALGDARRWAAMQVETEHILYALTHQEGTDATLVCRQATGKSDPWPHVRQFVGTMVRRRVGDLSDHTTVFRRDVPDEGSGAEMVPRADRVVALLYLLMRDHLPTAKLEALTRDLSGRGSFEFTAKELEALAQRYAERLFS